MTGGVWGVGEGGGVDDDGFEARVAFVFAANGEKAGLGGDGELDFFGDFDAALAFEADFGEEEFYVVAEAFLEACREFGYEGNVAGEDGVPAVGEGGIEDSLFFGAVASAEEVLGSEEDGGEAEEDEEEDVGGHLEIVNSE